jgi:FdhD protein
MTAGVKTAKVARARGSEASVPATVLLAAGGSREWHLAEEVPVNLSYNGRPHVVMMATPEDLEDFAVGFSLSEGVLASADRVRAVKVKPVEGGIMVDIATATRAEVVRERQARSLEGRSGCGLCGMQRLDQVVRDVRPVRADYRISAGAIARALSALPERQAMNRVNHSVHAAAWADPDGAIILVREDVGRHNALDKLIGAMARAKTEPSRGFCVMTSRCSFELVQKCAAVGIPCLATVSAPTSLALDLARRAGMVLASASPDGVVLFDTV